MSTIPILFAVAGISLLVLEIWSFIYIRRAFKAGKLSQQWNRRRIIAFVVGALLVVMSVWQHYPLGGGTVAGIPFSAAWYDAKGHDFIGVITLPALLGNLAVWFLLPQIVLAYIAHRHLSSHEHKT